MNDEARELTAREVAQTAYAEALRAVAQSLRILQQELAELDAAGLDLRRAGGVTVSTLRADALAEGVKGQVKIWQLTDAGRELLNMERLPTRRELALATARHDLAGAEENLARVKALPATEHTAHDRRRAIEQNAANVVHMRRRLAEMEPGTLDQFKAWLRTFAADVKRALDAPVIVARPVSETLARMEAQDQAAARTADPFGSLVRDALDQA